MENTQCTGTIEVIKNGKTIKRITVNNWNDYKYIDYIDLNNRREYELTHGLEFTAKLFALAHSLRTY